MVNPSRNEVFGQPCYPSVTAVPATIDHAVILVAAHRVCAVVSDCVEAGVTSATVVGSGFGEAGPEGQKLSESLRTLCEASGMAIVGPNCFGFNNFKGIYVSRYVVSGPSIQGQIGFSFQSGQLGAGVMDAAHVRGIKLAYGVSSGNELVVDWNDYQEYFLSCPEIKVIGGVLERIPDPSRFTTLAMRALEMGKPIVVLKPGRSNAAEQIALSHTGSITGSDAIADAFLRDLGVIRVESLEELAETAGLLATRGWPVGGRTSYVGFSGGAAELFADQANGSVLEVNPHSPAVHEELSRITGIRMRDIHNPFDMTADGMPLFDAAVEAIASSGDIDIIVSQGTPRRERDAELDVRGESRAARERALSTIAAKFEKFAVFLDTSDTQPGDAVFGHETEAQAFYALGFIGVRAIINATTYGVARNYLLESETPPDVPDINLPEFPSGPLSEQQSKGLLEAYGIAATSDEHVDSVDGAVRAAEHIGYPVVIKIDAKNALHKSEVGGVRVGLEHEEAIRQAYDEMLADVRSRDPDISIQGVVVCPQIMGGLEMLCGVVSDPNLGPAVVVGFGGVFVELFNDVAMGTLPITRKKAHRMLHSLRGYDVLKGARGQAGFDTSAVVDVLVRLGAMAGALGDRLAELDINPLFVLHSGVVAGDALAVLR
jgi:acetyltransferase